MIANKFAAQLRSSCKSENFVSATAECEGFLLVEGITVPEDSHQAEDASQSPDGEVLRIASVKGLPESLQRIDSGWHRKRYLLMEATGAPDECYGIPWPDLSEQAQSLVTALLCSMLMIPTLLESARWLHTLRT